MILGSDANLDLLGGRKRLAEHKSRAIEGDVFNGAVGRDIAVQQELDSDRLCRHTATRPPALHLTPNPAPTRGEQVSPTPVTLAHVHLSR